MTIGTRQGVIANVQVLRFVAALLVIVAHGLDVAERHGLTVPGGLGDFGAIGVDIFFVISGFIITRTGFLGRPRNARGFLRDRVRRVVPLYWLMSLPWLPITLIDHSFWIRRPIVTLTFWPAVRGRVVNPLLEIGWTLCFEMLFYVAAAVALALPRRPALVLLAAAFVGCWILRVTTGIAAFRFLGNPIVLEFAFGVLIALPFALSGPRVGGLALALGVAAMIVSLIYGFGRISESEFTTDGTLSLTRALVWGLPSALVVFGAVMMRDWPVGRWAERAGDASYAMYLVHPLWLYGVAGAATYLTTPAPVAILVWAIGGSLAAGLLVHRLIERPLLRATGARGERGAGQPAGGGAVGVVTPVAQAVSAASSAAAQRGHA